jgi:uncharacterized protein YgiM (DUF1202 family)
MLEKERILKRYVTAFASAALVAMLIPGNVFADETAEIDLHAGAAAVMQGTAQDEQQDEQELSAGVALYMTADAGDTSEDVADAEDDAAQAQENAQDDTLVMANVNDAVNVRADASEEADTVGKLYKNCGGVILDRKDGWTYLQSGELTGWTKDDFLLFGEDAQNLQAEVGCLKATVKTDALRVRKEADENSGIYTLAELGSTSEVIEEAGDWVEVKVDDSTTGYVSADYVDVAFTIDTGKTNEQIAKEEEEEQKKELSKNRGAVSVEVSDVTLLAALIQCEAGRESYEGQLAVGAVVMNRVRSGSYPSSVSGVINAQGQFPPATNGKVAAVVAQGPSASCIEAAQAAINGATNVGGATHFRAAGSNDGIVIGNHVFW